MEMRQFLLAFTSRFFIHFTFAERLEAVRVQHVAPGAHGAAHQLGGRGTRALRSGLHLAATWLCACADHDPEVAAARLHGSPRQGPLLHRAQGCATRSRREEDDHWSGDGGSFKCFRRGLCHRRWYYRHWRGKGETIQNENLN